MLEKPKKKKRIVLRILLILLILLLVAIAVPIITLYVQYNKISYIPMEPVERSDVYVFPEYPEVIPGSEGITDFPDDPQTPSESTVETCADTDISESEPDVSTSETLPPVINEPAISSPSAEASTVPKSNDPAVTTAPKLDSPNSFGNSTNIISVYGRTPIYKVEQRDDNIINILVLGTDSRNVVKDRGRSDSMIVVSYNKKTGTIKMVSLLRDMLVPIEGYDWNRINAAYFFDGVGLSVNTVNQLFGLDIQHFIVIDFHGAKDFIDCIGGIKLTLSESEAKFVGVPYSTEPIQLDGYTALMHMRNRFSDNDFGRTQRQREVIMAVFNKIISEKSLTEILDITQYAMGMVKTNISAATLTSLAVSIVSNAGDISIETQSVPYKDAFQYAWYKKKAILSFDIESTAERLLDFLYE